MTLHPDPWPPGTPAWVDLVVPDLDTARSFYAAVLGWELTEATAVAGGSTYLMATVGGHAAAGLGDVSPDAPAPPAAWTVYLATDDVTAGVEAAVAAGATLLVPATRAGDAGAFAVLTDPAGAVFGLWEAGAHPGAVVVDEPGALAWAEAMSRDQALAMDFYASLVGWTYTDMSGPGFTYASFAVDGATAGGIGAIGPDAGPEVTPHWLVYFQVTDTDATVDRVLANGGAVGREPWDTAFGRVAVVTGPEGETFALLAPLATEPAEGTGDVRTA